MPQRCSIFMLMMCLAMASCAKPALETPPAYVPKNVGGHGDGGGSRDSTFIRRAANAETRPKTGAAANSSPDTGNPGAKPDVLAAATSTSESQKNPTSSSVAASRASEQSPSEVSPKATISNDVKPSVVNTVAAPVVAMNVARASKLDKSLAPPVAVDRLSVGARTNVIPPASPQIEPPVAAVLGRRSAPQTIALPTFSNAPEKSAASTPGITPELAASSPRPRAEPANQPVDWLERLAGVSASAPRAPQPSSMSQAEALMFLRANRASHVALWSPIHPLGFAIAREEAIRQIEQGGDSRFVIAPLAATDPSEMQDEVDRLAVSQVPSEWLRSDAADVARRDRLARRAAVQDADRAGREKLQTSVYDFLLGDRPR